ncbi:hypothetical protein PU01_17140 [Hafnia alvei]|nr:hypothetical protein PU01_17140 [Hafnia alvei]
MNSIILIPIVIFIYIITSLFIMVLFYFKLKKISRGIDKIKKSMSDTNEDNIAIFQSHSSIKNDIYSLSQEIATLRKKESLNNKESDSIDLYELNKAI